MADALALHARACASLHNVRTPTAKSAGVFRSSARDRFLRTSALQSLLAVDDSHRCVNTSRQTTRETSEMESLHNTLTHTIALFASAAPIVFALVAVLTAVLNCILRLDRHRMFPMLGDERAKLVRTLLSYLANSDVGMESRSHRKMRAE
jgi:hypothetical protein